MNTRIQSLSNLVALIKAETGGFFKDTQLVRLNGKRIVVAALQVDGKYVIFSSKKSYKQWKQTSDTAFPDFDGGRGSFTKSVLGMLHHMSAEKNA